MKYTVEVEINKPLNETVAAFKNPDNLKEWQPGFLSIEHLSGEKGQPGAKSAIKYQMGNREIDMIETIVANDLPERFDAIYDANGVLNKQENTFQAVAENKTRWISHSEFKFSGFMKLMGWVMPGAFKKQSWKYMEQFKQFVEST